MISDNRKDGVYMPFCPNCGKGLPTDAVFCPSCGSSLEVNTNNDNSFNEQPACPPVAPSQYTDDGAARRQKLLDNFSLRLKWELKAWSIAEKVWCIMGGAFLGISLLMMIIGFANIGDPGMVALPMSFSYLFVGATYLGIGIVNSVLKSKVRKYMEGLYYDCGPAVTRGESIGMIVFNALFNTVALVFYLINFITVKEHRSEFEEIRRLQLSARNNNYYN